MENPFGQYQQLLEEYRQAPFVQGNPILGNQLTTSFSFDRGSISNIFDLGYVPTQTSIPVVIGLFVCVLVFFAWWFFYGKKHLALVTFLCILAASMMFLGPIRVPAYFGVSTTIGVGKVLACIALIFGWLRLFSAPSFVAVGLYAVMTFSSVLYVSNIENFVTDASLIVGGLLFYFAAFAHIKNNAARIILLFGMSLASLWSTGTTLATLVTKRIGLTIVQMAYPKYENIVFLFDQTRGRILSIGDIEFVVPGILGLISVFKNRVFKIFLVLIFAATMTAVFLTNYRTRALVALLGTLVVLVSLPRTVKRKVIPLIALVMTGLFVTYLAVYTGMGKPTLISRFLLENSSTDRDSILRRSISFERTMSMFAKYPLFGVGLGGFRDNVLVSYENFGGRVNEPFYQILENIYAYPHNWFTLVLAEHGVVGFLILVYLLYVFLKTDLWLMTKVKEQERIVLIACSVTSWLYVFSNMVTPLYSSQPMVIIFWTMRGVLDRAYYNIIKNTR